MVYAKFEPPLSDEQLQLIKDSDALLGTEYGETNYTNRIIRFRPDWGDFSESLELKGKDIVLKIGELLATEGIVVTTDEALLNGRDWHFDEPVETAPITREAVDHEIRRKRSNEQAALLFAGSLGGWGAVLASDAKHTVLQILDSDPNDDLSGLREIAGRNFVRPFSNEQQGEAVSDLAVVSPQAARHWLLKQRRAKELPTGELRIIGENKDHMTQAGLWIAQQEDCVDFVTAYRSMNPDSPLTDKLVLEAGASITASYVEED